MRAIVGEACPFCGRTVLAIFRRGRGAGPDVLAVHHDQDADAWTRGEPTRVCYALVRVTKEVEG